MFDIGWSELMLIGIVALIVVGPKDLPKLFHALGQFTAKARGMARDFQRAMEQAAREAGAEDIAKDLKTIGSVKSMGLDALSGATKKIDEWGATKRAATAATVVEEVAEPAPMGPATAELVAQVRANAAAAEAAAKERAAARNLPTPEELADIEPDIAPEPVPEPAPKPARKPRAKAPVAEATVPPAAEVAVKPARAPRKPKAVAATDAPAPKLRAKSARKSDA